MRIKKDEYQGVLEKLREGEIGVSENLSELSINKSQYFSKYPDYVKKVSNINSYLREKFELFESLMIVRSLKIKGSIAFTLMILFGTVYSFLVSVYLLY